MARRRHNPDGALLWVLGGAAVLGVGYWLYSQSQNQQNIANAGTTPGPNPNASSSSSNPVNNTINTVSQDASAGTNLANTVSSALGS